MADQDLTPGSAPSRRASFAPLGDDQPSAVRGPPPGLLLRLRLPRPDHIRSDQVVPAAGRTHLHHIDLQLAVPRCEHGELPGDAGPAGALPELVAVGVGDMDEWIAASADRASLRGPLTVVPGRPQQIRMRVTGIQRRDSAREEIRQRRPAGERVVDDRPRTHASNGTPESASRQTVQTDGPDRRQTVSHLTHPGCEPDDSVSPPAPGSGRAGWSPATDGTVGQRPPRAATGPFRCADLGRYPLAAGVFHAPQARGTPSPGRDARSAAGGSIDGPAGVGMHQQSAYLSSPGRRLVIPGCGTRPATPILDVSLRYVETVVPRAVAASRHGSRNDRRRIAGHHGRGGVDHAGAGGPRPALREPYARL